MNRNRSQKKWIASIVLSGSFCALLISIFHKTTPNQPSISDEVRVVSSSAGRAPATLKGSTSREDEASLKPSMELGPLSQEESRSVESLLGLFAKFETVGKSPALLVSALREIGLEPKISIDSNEETGSLTIIRTENALPGTRHYHAQLFENEDGTTYIQHQSFEIRPGPDAMEQAISFIRQHFKVGEKPKYQSKDYVLWATGDGRVVSAKRLSAEDLDNSHFNARFKDDIGAVWVVSEEDPHGGEGEDHSHVEP